VITLQLDSREFSRMERSLLRVADGKQVRFAAAQAVNDCTRGAGVAVNKAMPDVFDRPTKFTDRAAVAPRDLAATPDRLSGVVTLRSIQAKYLKPEEIGGTRTPADNTRKAAQALVLPGKSLQLDAFGNIPAGLLARLRQAAASNRRQRRKRGLVHAFKGQKAAAAAKVNDDNTVVFLPRDVPGNRAGIGGFFRRLPDHKLTRLTGFEPATSYTPRLGYHERVEQTVRATWPAAMRRRLLAALATAR
jgi:hypothetical protein